MNEPAAHGLSSLSEKITRHAVIPATTSFAEARQTVWEAVVIGAGPAGAVTALGLARKGRRVLLLDRSRFPRRKICGGCLNADAVSSLRKLGLGSQLSALGGELLNRVCLSAGGRRVWLTLPPGVAVSREALDAMLVESAIAAGADFLPNVTVHLGGSDNEAGVRHVIRSTADSGCSSPLQSRTVVVATGLSPELRGEDPALTVRASLRSRIGLGTTSARYPDDYAPGTIFMAIGRAGYVGVTRIDGNRLNIAAAMDVAAVRNIGPSAVCERILLDAGFPVSQEMLSNGWCGTVGLTRHRLEPASYRVFVVGDAATYVEPFTGEGMAWAIRAGRAIVPFIEQAVSGWGPRLPVEWSRTLRRLVIRRQIWCRTCARLLRHPMLARGAIRIVGSVPAIGRAVIRRLNQGNRDEFFDSGPGHGRAA